MNFDGYFVWKVSFDFHDLDMWFAKNDLNVCVDVIYSDGSLTYYRARLSGITTFHRIGDATVHCSKSFNFFFEVRNGFDGDAQISTMYFKRDLVDQKRAKLMITQLPDRDDVQSKFNDLNPWRADRDPIALSTP